MERVCRGPEGRGGSRWGGVLVGGKILGTFYFSIGALAIVPRLDLFGGIVWLLELELRSNGPSTCICFGTSSRLGRELGSEAEFKCRLASFVNLWWAGVVGSVARSYYSDLPAVCLGGRKRLSERFFSMFQNTGGLNSVGGGGRCGGCRGTCGEGAVFAFRRGKVGEWERRDGGEISVPIEDCKLVPLGRKRLRISCFDLLLESLNWEDPLFSLPTCESTNSSCLVSSGPSCRRSPRPNTVVEPPRRQFPRNVAKGDRKAWLRKVRKMWTRWVPVARRGRKNQFGEEQRKFKRWDRSSPAALRAQSRKTYRHP